MCVFKGVGKSLSNGVAFRISHVEIVVSVMSSNSVYVIPIYCKLEKRYELRNLRKFNYSTVNIIIKTFLVN